jgi:MerR family mercuric resistance operon transcriptional regulator
MGEKTLTIGALARAAGVNVETVRYYQRIGLMPVPQKACGRIRRYTEADCARLRFIKAAQGLGFTLEEVAELVKLDDGTHCAKAQAIAARKLADVRARLRRLRRIEAALARLLRQCARQRGAIRCPLIAALQGQD